MHFFIKPRTTSWCSLPILSSPVILVSPDSPEPVQDLCKCGHPSVCTSQWRDNDNSGRRFIQCKNYKKEGGCDFFQWSDPPVHWRYKEVLNTLFRGQVSLRKEIATLRCKISRMEMKKAFKKRREQARLMAEMEAEEDRVLNNNGDEPAM